MRNRLRLLSLGRSAARVVTTGVSLMAIGKKPCGACHNGDAYVGLDDRTQRHRA